MRRQQAVTPFAGVRGLGLHRMPAGPDGSMLVLRDLAVYAPDRLSALRAEGAIA